MRDNWNNCGGCCGFARRPDVAKRKSQRVVLGGTPAFVADIADRLRRLGWDACTAESAEELYVVTARKNPAAVILPVEAGEETGFLACAKLRLTRPKLRVVLVGTPTARAERFARFVGAAALVPEAEAAEATVGLM